LNTYWLGLVDCPVIGVDQWNAPSDGLSGDLEAVTHALNIQFLRGRPLGNLIPAVEKFMAGQPRVSIEKESQAYKT
jgi:hypothetical protein